MRQWLLFSPCVIQTRQLLSFFKEAFKQGMAFTQPMRHSNASYISFSSESFKRGTGFYLAYMSITFLFQCVIQTRPFLFFSTCVIQRSQLLSFTIHHSNEMLALLFQMCYSNEPFAFFISHVIQTSQLLPFYDAAFKRITWSSFPSCVIQTSQCIFFYPLCNSNASIQFLFSSATYRLIICFFPMRQ